ncbi:MAG: FGGY family carbohydrate kinase, partial [Defluviitaleaceae bacterium]|nr:FGGY family carbohydrate kinase [Defluviitaleaceae bacterium]
MKYYLAIDIGASGGRHILGHVKDGRLVCEEVHRFPNGMIEKNSSLCWDMDALFDEILKGMKRCAELGKIPTSVGIDTWGVDFVLLDKNGGLLGDAVAYRDNRTDKMDEAVFRLIPEAALYQRTGIPHHLFNTIFQLMAIKHSGNGLLEKAHTMLMVPDYLHYRLSGVAKTEYTEATTSGLVNAENKNWDDEIINICGFPRHIFAEIVPPGTQLGGLLPEIQAKIGYNAQVVVPASHDTGSAVMAVPSDQDNTLYISSG